MSSTPTGRRLLALAALLLATGCRSPFDDPYETLLGRAVNSAVERELAGLPPADVRLDTVQAPSDVEVELSERLDELDALGPAARPDGLPRVGPEDLGPDLTGSGQKAASVDLGRAIRTAVERNLAVQLVRLQPAIRETDVVAAEAAFDAIFFGGVTFSKIDQPNPVPVLNGNLLGTPSTANESWRFESGLRQRLTSGGQVSVSTEMTRTNSRTPGFTLSPDPAYESAVRLRLDQPLLRNFGSEANLAAVRIARNDERRSIQDLRVDLLDVVAETETAYWNLALAWHDLAIRRWLVDVGTGVRDVLDRRREVDVTLAELSDAVARVEQRKAEVIRAQRRVRGASDRLKALMNAEDLTVGDETVIAPLDPMVESPIAYSLRDAIVTALAERPEVQQAILAIDDASIREALADNQRLPLLNMNAEMAFLGLDGDAADSYDEIDEARFVDYIVGLVLELPIGNRAAEAGYRRARLERSAAVINYRRIVQTVVGDVKSALRDVVTNYELIQATRSFRIAQAENLRALQAEEETLASLTPEFLDLKLTRQETLAQARLQEILALVNFDQAVARLHQAMGIGLRMNRIAIEVVDDAPAGVDDDR